MIVSQMIDESNTVYNYRVDFCEKFKKKNSDCSDKQIIIYSKMLANIKFKGCRYDSKIYNKLKSYL